MSHSSSSSESTHTAKPGNAEASLSLFADATQLPNDPSLSYPPAPQTSEVTLPRLLTPSVTSASHPASNACGGDATAMARHRDVPSPLLPQTRSQNLRTDVKPTSCAREESEPASLFSSRNRATEMSSFGISVSTATAAGGAVSASAAPLRWLKSSDVRAIGVGADFIQPCGSGMRKDPNYVFERAVQRQAIHTETEEDVMLHAAAYFTAVLD
ncbi:hypothetical protein ABB37_09120 [Leptomonas pyrrhocoris]|uniref:Uncharacterized protein n=1 Tax=Leptomonas pyrrhocoris TaxID=157538 RepID=A0A0N0DRG8_LEPPY|nr:hypothetical protein ABB37_09120 [Leptomonas pyrrhocoris]KPA74422.1 hypothetical protein ABB37_09120 [Leptomonas pyrrhocoris]|eukprot:XP_015652861.1 hypothetical protein ABB37_09120 [Leptomonas pyrrhocoris]